MATPGNVGTGLSGIGKATKKAGKTSFFAETLADPLGTLTGTDIVHAEIPNALASSLFDTAVLVDPVKIEAYKVSVASQMNRQAGWVCSDLSERIGDIVVETAAQGASTLTLSIADPGWFLLTGTTDKGDPFITVDEDGYIWPPIDVHFPTDTDCWWRLCQVRYTNDLTGGPNGTLTFEDRIVSILRERSHLTGGIKAGSPGQSLAGFIKQLVDDANKHAGAKIKLIELLAPAPQDPNSASPSGSQFAPSKPGQKPHKTDAKGLSPDQIRQIQDIAISQKKIIGGQDSLQNLERLIYQQETSAPPPHRLGAVP